MTELASIKCSVCGAMLDAEINREFIFCRFCGNKMRVETERMTLNFRVGGAEISARTDMESILKAVSHNISVLNYNKAAELIDNAVLSGCNDHMLYIYRAQLNLLKDNNAGLFRDLEILRNLERSAPNGGEVTQAVRELMRFRGMNGVTALHNATFHELMEWVEYCVEHGADVNCIAGMNCVSPISIMFVQISTKMSRLDGTPFVRNKRAVKEIRKYLMDHGAKDRFRLFY